MPRASGNSHSNKICAPLKGIIHYTHCTLLHYEFKIFGHLSLISVEPIAYIQHAIRLIIVPSGTLKSILPYLAHALRNINRNKITTILKSTVAYFGYTIIKFYSFNTITITKRYRRNTIYRRWYNQIRQ